MVRVNDADVDRLDRLAARLVGTRSTAVAHLLDLEDGIMAKRIGPGPRAVTEADGAGTAIVPADQVDVWRGALAALDAAREAVRQCAVYASSRPGQSHAGAVAGRAVVLRPRARLLRVLLPGRTGQQRKRRRLQGLHAGRLGRRVAT